MDHQATKFKTPRRQDFNDPNEFYALAMVLYNLLGDDKF